LMVLRVDQPGTCGNSCVMLDSVVARGIDHAVANGARVINISLNGSPADTASRNAIAAAAAAGVVMVVSAGNDALDNPDRYAASVLAAGGDHVIIAGAVGATGHISSFSNRAGNADTAPFVLMALGEGLCCLYEGSQIFTDANGNNRVLLGTSFSAPQISGAVALLA